MHDYFVAEGNALYLEDGVLMAAAQNADNTFEWDNPVEVDLAGASDLVRSCGEILRGGIA